VDGDHGEAGKVGVLEAADCGGLVGDDAAAEVERFGGEVRLGLEEQVGGELGDAGQFFARLGVVGLEDAADGELDDRAGGGLPLDEGVAVEVAAEDDRAALREGVEEALALGGLLFAGEDRPVRAGVVGDDGRVDQEEGAGGLEGASGSRLPRASRARREGRVKCGLRDIDDARERGVLRRARRRAVAGRAQPDAEHDFSDQRRGG
jgi:hypothetical protein